MCYAFYIHTAVHFERIWEDIWFTFIYPRKAELRREREKSLLQAHRQPLRNSGLSSFDSQVRRVCMTGLCLSRGGIHMQEKTACFLPSRKNILSVWWLHYFAHLPQGYPWNFDVFSCQSPKCDCPVLCGSWSLTTWALPVWIVSSLNGPQWSESWILAEWCTQWNMKREGTVHRLGDNPNIRLLWERKKQQVQYSEEAQPSVIVREPRWAT